MLPLAAVIFPATVRTDSPVSIAVELETLASRDILYFTESVRWRLVSKSGFFRMVFRSSKNYINIVDYTKDTQLPQQNEGEDDNKGITVMVLYAEIKRHN